jgi:hypothetical protein
LSFTTIIEKSLLKKQLSLKLLYTIVLSFQIKSECSLHFPQFKTQNENGGKCGICGDAYNLPHRPHEAPGKFATGIIVRSYVPGQVKHNPLELKH